MATHDGDLQGQVAIITGAASGIARATVRLAAERGARVAALDIRDEAAREAVDELTAAGLDVTFQHCDVMDRQSVEATVQAVLDRYGQIDILANVVGGSQLISFWELTEEDWDRQIRFNLKSQFLTCRAVVPHMIERRSGAIVNVASGQAFFPAPQRAPYSAAKAGVAAMSRCLAAEIAQFRVRVNVVAPGVTATDRAKSIFTPEEWEQWTASQPLGRAAEPEDIAEAILFLAGPRGRHVNGQILNVNGGSFMPS
jgi:NAD(P)-dependent dehydrogenase (short-subunit alcohol dehydrogenase family)